MTPLETYIKDNSILNIFHDESAESPREWDNLGTIVANHPRYKIGDEQVDVSEWMIQMVKKITQEDVEQINISEALEVIRQEYFIEPVYMLDHSGISLSTKRFNDPWDSGLIGFIYASKEKIKEEGVDESKVSEYFEGELETYTQYINGEVYGWVLKEKRKFTKIYEDGTEEEEEEYEDTDSYWGYYSIDQILSELDFTENEKV